MLFWLIIGVVGLGLYFLSRNRTEKKDHTIITHKRTIQTPDGEVHIQRTQTIDSVRTTYTKQDLSKQIIKDIALPNTPNNSEIPNSKEVESRPLIICNDQPHRFAHQTQQSTNEVPREENTFSLISPKVDIQQNLFEENCENKICPNCERTLHFNSFRKSSKYPDGLTKWCIDCLNNYQARLPKNKKQCPKCKKIRLKSSYYKNKNTEDGLTKWCTTCMDKSRK